MKEEIVIKGKRYILKGMYTSWQGAKAKIKDIKREKRSYFVLTQKTGFMFKEGVYLVYMRAKKEFKLNSMKTKEMGIDWMTEQEEENPLAVRT